MRNYKWIKDTEIARKLYDGRIIDSRFDHESEEFDIRVFNEVPDPDPEDGTVYVAPSTGIYTISSSSMSIRSSHNYQYVDEDGYVRYCIEDDEITPESRLEMTGTREIDLE